ncbi:MAG: hypothetical protein ABIK79_01015 [Chloroflexota bacterium]|nr:hypothetical protein [Anaerolineae bacterium]
MDKKIASLQRNITKKNLVVLVSSILLIASLVTAVSVGANPLRDEGTGTTAEGISGEELTLTSVSPVINYQGRLLRDEQPVDGVETIIFRLYDAQYGGVRYWEENAGSVTVNNGLFAHALGSITTLPIQSFDRELWLETQVGSVILPRQRLAGAAYALSLVPGGKITGTETNTAALTVENTATSGTALSAVSASNAPAIKATNNAGGPVIAGYGLGGDSKFEVSNNGDIIYDGALQGAFPRPAYDSGWISINKNQDKELFHWLGGSIDSYVVDLTFWDDDAEIAKHGYNGYGLGAFRRPGELYGSGAFWHKLTPQSIVVKRKAEDDWVDKFRVRIWVIK